ncbi:MAG TPA: RnfH family protein [Wenzhouxiangella sp.]|nr:RnfH family protein [Wenzhouxiangella sp.]
MAAEGEIEVEVAAATPETQVVVSVRVPAGTTLIEAVEKADVPALIPGFEVSPERVGVFGRLRPPDTPLQAGDRAEAYRALTADPKEIRRQMAELARARKRK